MLSDTELLQRLQLASSRLVAAIKVAEGLDLFDPKFGDLIVGPKSEVEGVLGMMPSEPVAWDGTFNDADFKITKFRPFFQSQFADPIGARVTYLPTGASTEASAGANFDSNLTNARRSLEKIVRRERDSQG